MNIICKIHKSLSTRNGKKYLELELNEKDALKILSEHKKLSIMLQNKKIKNPLDDNILEVKVPFRYNKVTCNVSGDKTIQELKNGDSVTIELKNCGVWNIGEWSGFAWKVLSLKG